MLFSHPLLLSLLEKLLPANRKVQLYININVPNAIISNNLYYNLVLHNILLIIIILLY